ncbi:MAG: hypothetical protein JWN15_1575 [Firmicutes bacterium]|nr:hypothetical protein [Bacillota bacterium]
MSEPVQDHYETARQCIGLEERIFLGTVTALHFQRFAQASGDLNPLYFDREYAREAGYEDVVAPPIFLTGVLGWEAGPSEESLRQDGLSDSDTAFIKLPGARLMGGGQEIEYLTPLRDGDQVTVWRKVVDVERHQSTSGDLLLMKLEKRYYNQHGDPLVICRETMIVR